MQRVKTAEATGKASDPDNDVVTLTAPVGNVILNNDNTWSWSFLTSDGPSQSQIVTITANDGNGGTAAATFNLTVFNVPPVVNAIDIPADPAAISDAITVTASFSDPADTFDQPYTCSIDYGDGTTMDGLAEGWICTFPEHIYSLPGVYTISVTITDKDGGSSSLSSSRYLVIYDPDGRFVTGEGWILLPPGAYKADPSVT